MKALPKLPVGPPANPLLDYEALRAEAIRALELLNDDRWSDFNTHDPGVTILEAICYALGDLGYRISHDLPDLLEVPPDAPAPASPLLPPGEALGGRAVTDDDLRRAVLDVPGVRNAWVEPADEARVPLRWDPARRAVLIDRPLAPGELPVGDPLVLRGLHRLLIEPEGNLSGGVGALRAAVAARAARHRSLGEDVDDIVVLDVLPVHIRARIVPERGASGEDVLVAAALALADYCSPTLTFRTAEEAIAAAPTDLVFDGPMPHHGFADRDQLAGAHRRRRLHLSDVIRVLVDVPGVATAHDVSFVGNDERWTLMVSEEKVANFGLAGSDLRLDGVDTGTQAVLRERVAAAFAEQRAGMTSAARCDGDACELPRPRGRSREVGAYRPLQLELPTAYGVGPGTLPSSASPSRRADSTRLRAYLAFFDHILATFHGELAALPNTLSASRSGPVAFPPAADVPEYLPSASAPSVAPKRREPAMAEADALKWRNALLNHLLARHAEAFRNDPLDEPLIARKEALLRDVGELAAARGTGTDVLAPPGTRDVPPVLRRLELELGLELGGVERLVLVEHILLRPVTADAEQDVPLLDDAASPDPYSLQVTLVVPARFEDQETRIASTLRDAVPAHLSAWLCFLDPEPFGVFLTAWDAFLDGRRARERRRYGIGAERSGGAA